MAPPSAPSRGTIPRSAAVNRSVLLRLRRRERDAGSALPLALDDAPLALGAADERGEIDGGGARGAGDPAPAARAPPPNPRAPPRHIARLPSTPSARTSSSTTRLSGE